MYMQKQPYATRGCFFYGCFLVIEAHGGRCFELRVLLSYEAVQSASGSGIRSRLNVMRFLPFVAGKVLRGEIVKLRECVWYHVIGLSVYRCLAAGIRQRTTVCERFVLEFERRTRLNFDECVSQISAYVRVVVCIYHQL